MSVALHPAQNTTELRIRSEALNLIAAQGYEAVSMREIAERVGVRPSAIYNYFESKQALLAELMVGHMERTLDAMLAALPADAGPAARLAAFARFHVGYHLDEPQGVFVAYMELRSLSPENRAAVGRLRDRYERTLCAILSEGMARGVFRVANPAVQSRALIAMMTGVTVWFRHDGPLDRARVIEEYVDLVMQSVGIATVGEETRNV